MDASRWTDPEWVASAQAWIAEELDRLDLRVTGRIEQPHVQRWATVMRVPTSGGRVWFKANTGSLQHEAGVVSLLAERAAGVVPPLLAADVSRGWMLMADAGERLRDLVPIERSLDRWLDVLASYARIQLACSDAVDELLALGVPDRRLSTLPSSYAAIVESLDVEPRFREAVGYVEGLCCALAGFGIEETLQHDDLHDGQVFVRDGRHLVMDWGDACISHPFFTLSVTLEGVIAWGLDDEEDSVDVSPFRDAYLEPFAAAYPGVDLRAAVPLALRLGWVCRVVNGHVPGEDSSTHARLRMFLDGRP